MKRTDIEFIITSEHRTTFQINTMAFDQTRNDPDIGYNAIDRLTVVAMLFIILLQNVHIMCHQRSITYV